MPLNQTILGSIWEHSPSICCENWAKYVPFTLGLCWKFCVPINQVKVSSFSLYTCSAADVRGLKK